MHIYTVQQYAYTYTYIIINNIFKNIIYAYISSTHLFEELFNEGKNNISTADPSSSYTSAYKVPLSVLTL